MFAKDKELSRVIVRVGETITDDEIDDIISGISPRAFDALILRLEDYRQDYAANAAQHATANNPLAMAREIGASEAIGNLITVLNDQRKPTE